jgi:hypothetical protein
VSIFPFKQFSIISAMQAVIMEGIALEKRLQEYLIPLLILLAAVVYWNTLPNDFVAGDRQFILRNKHIGEISTVLNSFTSDYWGKLGGESFMYYRPLVILTHFIDVTLYGLNPAGHHLTNILFHCLVTVTVYLFFLSFLSGKRWPAFAGAALFALHPVHTHSVSYVMGRTDMLATLFYLWSLILLANGRKSQTAAVAKLPLAVACLCFFCALLCKEIAITLPLTFILYRFCRDAHRFSWKDRSFISPLLGLMATAICYLVMRSFAVGPGAQYAVLQWYSFSQHVWLVFKTLGFYLVKLLFPVQLCYYSNIVVPGSFSEVLSSPLTWTSILFLAATAASLQRFRILGFALGWLLLTLLPVLNIVMLPALAKENYLYLPSIGFCLGFAVIVDRAMQARSIRSAGYRRVALCGTMLIALFFTAGTINRNHDYKTPLSFLQSTVKTMNPVPFSHREDPRFFEPVKNFYTTFKNLGIIYQERNQPEQAILAFTSALGYTPVYFSTYYVTSVKVLLANSLVQTGRLEEATLLLKEARPFVENPVKVDNRLGMILRQLGHNSETEVCVNQATMNGGWQDR